MLRKRGRVGQGLRFRLGKRSLSSPASQKDDDFFFSKKFVLLQSCYGIQGPPYFTSYELWRWFYRRWQIYCSLRLWRLSLCRAVFVFVLKLKLNTDLEQLLTSSYLKFRLLKRIQCCCNVLPYLSSLKAPQEHVHPVPESTANSCLY